MVPFSRRGARALPPSATTIPRDPASPSLLPSRSPTLAQDPLPAALSRPTNSPLHSPSYPGYPTLSTTRTPHSPPNHSIDFGLGHNFSLFSITPPSTPPSSPIPIPDVASHSTTENRGKDTFETFSYPLPPRNRTAPSTYSHPPAQPVGRGSSLLPKTNTPSSLHSTGLPGEGFGPFKDTSSRARSSSTYSSRRYSLSDVTRPAEIPSRRPVSYATAASSSPSIPPSSSFMKMNNVTEYRP